MKVPLIIVTGYLGSGKTTFLRRVIENVKDKKNSNNNERIW
jgi:Putative GTPases (G3E family)